MELNIAKEATQKKILKNMGMVAALVADIAKGYELDSWQAYNEYVKNGVGKEVFTVGDSITTKYTATNGTQYDLEWVIAGFKDKVINNKTYKDVPILLTPYATLESVVFGINEAMYFAPPGGLAAGTYNIHVGTGYEGFTAGTDFQFVLSAALPAGGQLFVKNIATATDPTNMVLQVFNGPDDTTARAEIQTSAGTGGTNLGTINARGRSLETGLNCIQRMRYGNGNYRESQQRQWANADALKDSWWEDMNPWQRKHSDASGKNGFLYGLPSDFKQILTPTKVRTAFNTVEADMEELDYYDTEDIMWIPSIEEMYGVPQLEGAEGPYLDYMKERTGLTDPSNGNCSTRIFYAMENHNSACYVRLRSAYRGYDTNAWLVYGSTGQLGGNGGNSSGRCVLACMPLNPAI